MTARTKIDVYAGTLSMEFGDDIVQFSILNAMRHLPEEHFVLFIDVIDEAMLHIGSESDDAETNVHIRVDVDSVGVEVVVLAPLLEF